MDEACQDVSSTHDQVLLIVCFVLMVALQGRSGGHHVVFTKLMTVKLKCVVDR